MDMRTSWEPVSCQVEPEVRDGWGGQAAVGACEGQLVLVPGPHGPAGYEQPLGCPSGMVSSYPGTLYTTAVIARSS